MSFVEELRLIVGDEQVITDSQLQTSYTTDWTKSWSSNPIAVVRPRTTTQVKDVLQKAAAFNIAVITQGGNTGLVGGSVGNDSFEHIIVSTRLLKSPMEFDNAQNQLTVGAGWMLSEVQQFAAEKNLEYAVDIAARDSATIGGTVATNAGGIHVIANGMTAAQVVGVEIVLSNGRTLQDISKEKENYEPNLNSEVVGSEGTLGVITTVRLQLKQKRISQWVAIAPAVSIDAAVEIAQCVGNSILAAEIMQTKNANTVAIHCGLQQINISQPWLVLLQSDGPLVDLPDDAIVALSNQDQRQLWEYRERHTEFIATQDQVLKFDAKVPVSHLQTFVKEVEAATTQQKGQVGNFYVFGHLLDGNLHLAIADVSQPASLQDRIAKLVFSNNGSIRAEHGIGQAKSRYVVQGFTPAELTERKIRRDRFDPFGIMNPSIA